MLLNFFSFIIGSCVVGGAVGLIADIEPSLTLRKRVKRRFEIALVATGVVSILGLPALTILDLIYLIKN